MPKPKYGIPLTPSEVASIAALERWGREDPTANAERGQRGLRDKFLREVDAEEAGLPEKERQRRAHVKYRLHMKRIRLQRSRRTRTVQLPADDSPGAA